MVIRVCRAEALGDISALGADFGLGHFFPSGSVRAEATQDGPRHGGSDTWPPHLLLGLTDHLGPKMARETKTDH